ncbi:MAG: outer-membrane lipoprotein carrier protein LolA [Prevotella sp.]|nr:outer-membrane lipoprotein carrier protein LolA [Prevotella sp.]
MKKIVLICMMSFVAMLTMAQSSESARKVLDKTASVVGRKGGASATFKVSSAKFGNTNGTISIKGNKFHATTSEAIVWFDGKTQWTYMKSTEEVNIITPNEAQQSAMNPYQFITLYKTGFNMSMKTIGSYYQVHLTAQNKKRSVQEMYININKNTYVPSQVKMRQGTAWTTINISNFKAVNQANSLFTFHSKDFPKAEVIDLR